MSDVIERYIQGRYSELKAGNAYLIYYQIDGFQMVELGRFAKNHELIRKIREVPYLNNQFQIDMITKYGELTRGYGCRLAIINHSMFTYRLDWSVFKSMEYYNTLPLLVRFHYSKKCKVNRLNKQAVNIDCYCQPYCEGRVKDYRLRQYDKFCESFNHVILVDGLSYRYNFLPAVKAYCTKYKKKSRFAKKHYISKKNWNNAVLKCEGWVCEPLLVTAVFLRSFFVRDAKNSGRGPPLTGLTHFPHTEGDINECTCNMHKRIFPVSMYIEDVSVSIKQSVFTTNSQLFDID